MSSFVRFVLSFKKDDTPWGDVARDFVDDGHLVRTWGYRTTRKYLEDYGACDDVLEIIKDINESYKKIRAVVPDQVAKKVVE
jgi:hypothetical protein